MTASRFNILNTPYFPRPRKYRRLFSKPTYWPRCSRGQYGEGNNQAGICEAEGNKRLIPGRWARSPPVIFYYDYQTILQIMTFGSSILIRFQGVHSHRSHSDTVAVLSSSVHLAQESRTNHKSHYKISKATSYMRHSVRRPPPWVMSHAHGSMTHLNKYRTPLSLYSKSSKQKLCVSA